MKICNGYEVYSLNLTFFVKMLNKSKSWNCQILKDMEKKVLSIQLLGIKFAFLDFSKELKIKIGLILSYRDFCGHLAYFKSVSPIEC